MDSPLPAAVSHWAEISQDKKSPFTQPTTLPCLCASKFKACKRQKEAKLPHITLQCFINMITLKLTDPQLKPIRPSPLASLPSAPLRLHPSQVVCTNQAPFRSLCSHMASKLPEPLATRDPLSLTGASVSSTDLHHAAAPTYLRTPEKKIMDGNRVPGRRSITLTVSELNGAVLLLDPLIYSQRAPSSITSTVKNHWIQNNREFQRPPASVDEPEVREQGGAASGAGRAGQAPGGA